MSFFRLWPFGPLVIWQFGHLAICSPVFLGILQFELLIRGAGSIKDKRRVVRSVKDHLHREHLVSVAEVAHLDNMKVAGMALALVNRDQKYLNGVLDAIVGKLRKVHDAELGSVYREVLSGSQLPGAYTTDEGEPLWTAEESRRLAAEAEAVVNTIAPGPVNANLPASRLPPHAERGGTQE